MSTPPIRPRRGFTLLELLIVIGIIGLLVALTVTIIPKVKRAAYGASTSAQLAAIATSVQAYYGDFRAYPGPLANGQLGGTYYATVPTITVNDPNANNVAVPLTFYNCDTVATTAQITGAENLVLGLLGGLEFTYNGQATGSTITAFQYNPANIFPDGATPAPKGPLILNPNAPKRFGAYLQVKAGDLSNSRVPGSTSMGLPTVFKDDGSKAAADSPIPEFIDKFSQQMPILYLRANVGAAGIVSYAQMDENSTALPAPYQYDLANVLGYTQSGIGVVPNAPVLNHHGLADILPTGGKITDPLMGTAGDYQKAGTIKSSIMGADGLVYFRDPNAPTVLPDGTTLVTNATGHPRQKDAFILISAGPDGVYGTADDIIYPGGSVTP